MSVHLFDVNELAKLIREWVKDTKNNYQIHDYEYSNLFKMGTVDNNELFVEVTLSPPQPILKYKVDIKDSKCVETYLQTLVEKTNII